MNATKTHEHVQKWRDLERRSRDVDFERSRWCRDVRGEFGPGFDGDREFLTWLRVSVMVEGDIARELLNRAQLAKLADDARAWTDLGGYRGLRPLLSVSASERGVIVAAALLENKAVRTVVREREAIRRSVATPQKPPAPSVAAATTPAQDDLLVATWVVKHAKRAPADVVAAARRIARRS